MKILEVTFIPPDLISGGGRGILQSIKSILTNSEMDYIGPEFDLSIFDEKRNLKKIMFLEPLKRTVRSIADSILHGATTAYYLSWVNIERQLDWSKYDCIHIESSRYNFVIRKAVRNKIPVIIRLHNIEHDYGYNALKRVRSLENLINYISYSFNEKKCIQMADELIFITDDDVKRALSLYKSWSGKITVNPFCTDGESLKETCVSRKKFTFLITGSLSFGPNEDGVKWFIKNVWRDVLLQLEETELIVAGSHPAEELKNLITNQSNITLIDTPEDMSIYLKKADVYIAPIFYGAGMKVKVAEALSYGLPVIGTDHAWIGYGNVDEGKIIANDKDDFIREILKIRRAKVDIKWKQRIQEIFNKNYSMESSIRRYHDILKRAAEI